jgi:glycerate 2-kinase
MAYVKNTAQLSANGNISFRKAVLDIIEHALSASDPYRATCELVNLKGDLLRVGELKFDLRNHPSIYLIGAGKATFPIARALEDILGDRITDGIIICKYGQKGKLNRSRLLLADHPIPDEAGLAAAWGAMALARQTQPEDIVFGCVTGGSSSLMPYPVKGVSLEEKRQVNRLLLTCGANIREINAVRKHLSRIKGGHLAAAIHPRAQLINLTVSDVIGDPLDYITDPTVPDTSTFDDARSTLTKYGLWPKVPKSVSEFLETAGPEKETPKSEDLAELRRHDIIILRSDVACVTAAYKAAELGFETMIISTMLEGESRELGRTFAAIAKEILQNSRPLKPPCAIIGGGETTVRIDGKYGEGGPNQEFALAAALDIEGLGSVVVAGIDTDGSDGPTTLAGGLADGQTVSRARAKALDLFACLRHHDAAAVLKALGDYIETGATGTNVNDLKLMLIGP